MGYNFESEEASKRGQTLKKNICYFKLLKKCIPKF